MSSVWYWEVAKRIGTELDKEIRDVGTGSCLTSEQNPTTVAMLYSQRMGYVMGLRKALEIAEQLESGKES